MLVRNITANAARKGQHRASQKQVGAAVGLLKKALPTDFDDYRAILHWLWQREEPKNLTAGEASATIGWLRGPVFDPKVWEPCADAIIDVAAIIMEIRLDEGQLELPLE